VAASYTGAVLAPLLGVAHWGAASRPPDRRGPSVRNGSTPAVGTRTARAAKASKVAKPAKARGAATVTKATKATKASRATKAAAPRAKAAARAG